MIDALHWHLVGFSYSNTTPYSDRRALPILAYRPFSTAAISGVRSQGGHRDTLAFLSDATRPAVLLGVLLRSAPNAPALIEVRQEPALAELLWSIVLSDVDV